VVVFKPILHPYSRTLLVGNDATLETVATRPRGEGKACGNNTMRIPNRRKVAALEQGARDCAGVGTWRGWIFFFLSPAPFHACRLDCILRGSCKSLPPGTFTGIGRKEPALMQGEPAKRLGFESMISRIRVKVQVGFDLPCSVY
jgi:hypothetical protein